MRDPSPYRDLYRHDEAQVIESQSLLGIVYRIHPKTMIGWLIQAIPLGPLNRSIGIDVALTNNASVVVNLLKV